MLGGMAAVPVVRVMSLMLKFSEVPNLTSIGMQTFVSKLLLMSRGKVLLQIVALLTIVR